MVLLETSMLTIFFPELDWLFLSKKFINSLDLKENMYTTQMKATTFYQRFLMHQKD